MRQRSIVRSTLPWVLVALVTVLGFAQARLAVAQQTYNYRMGIVVSRTALGGEFAMTFIETAKAKSNGRINIELYDRGQLGGETEMVANLRVGELDLAVTGSGIVASVEPTFSLTELPLIWKSPEHTHRTLDGAVGQRMMSLLAPKGIKGLAFGEWGYRNLLIRAKRINTVADLRGMKIRVIENPLYVATWRAFDANPVPMAWPEVYTGFQQGTIDAVDTPSFAMVDSKLYEVAKHLAVTGHIFTALVLSMNLDKWNALPPDLQKVVLEAAQAGQKANRARATEANQQAIEFMKGKGIQVTQPDLGAFRERARPVYKRFEAQIGPDLIRQVQAGQ